jgi:DNA end-binding protein Ku
MSTRTAATRTRRPPRRPAREPREPDAPGRGRADWKGHIAFGLVEIPVALRHAERRTDELHFSLVDRRDHAPVGNLRVNKTTGEEVPWPQIVKGYEHEPGEYVLLDESELRQANVEASRSIEILDFVEGSAIDPAFYSDPYLVLPARSKGNVAYVLLRDALRKTGRVGIARVVLRTREHLAALTVRGPLLALDLLRWPHELLRPEDVKLPEGALSSRAGPRELELAEKLVDSLSGHWEPAQYKDRYRDDVLALIHRKVKSGKVEPVVTPQAEREEAGTPVLDLMPLLRQSVGRRAETKRPRRSARRPARRTA